MSRKKAKAPLGVAGLIAGVVALAVVFAPGTLSYFVSSTQTQAVSISTGEAALSISGTGGSNSGVYPGGPAQLIAARSIANTGDVSLGLASAFSATGGLAASVIITVSVQAAACASTPPSSWPADSGHWQGTTAGLTTAVPTTLATDVSRTLCVWQGLDANAPNGTQGKTAAVNITLTGTQTAP
ncbi:hypothetical protein [Microbacterium sulfonylureivorans]|uniref:hypothetical protein n=1 Tax=Microbacterium sulfonylureivorans TaxID=2486854 RepID=UPI000FDB2AF2|nr:hypothetical protein [Microbacterium sulfonylureivorans]